LSRRDTIKRIALELRSRGVIAQVKRRICETDSAADGRRDENTGKGFCRQIKSKPELIQLIKNGKKWRPLQMEKVAPPALESPYHAFYFFNLQRFSIFEADLYAKRAEIALGATR
jgi:hypothetical protein